MAKRTEPLSARTGVETPAAAAPPKDSTDGPRFARLAEGVRQLRTSGAKLNLSERSLMIAGGVVAPLGLLVVFLGWYGASHTPNVYEQIPYLISGGLFGLGLVFLGAFFYFTHWVTELVKEHRAQSAALLDAINRLEATVSKEAGNDRVALAKAVSGNGRSGTPAPDETVWEPEADLVATTKGSMAHRPDCVVVAGKAGLRSVTADEGLVPCKLCDPYAMQSEGQSLS